MELQDFLAHVDGGNLIVGGSEHHRFMHDAAQEAFRLTAELNSTYRTPEQVRDIISQLTGREVDDSVTDDDLEQIAGTLLANPVIESWTVTWLGRTGHHPEAALAAPEAAL